MPEEDWLMTRHEAGRSSEVATRERGVLRYFAPGPLVDWDLLAACRGLDTEKFYGTAEALVARAKGICDRCSVQTDCLAVADEMERDLGPRMVHGIWGGLTPDERIERRRASPRLR